MKLIRKVVLLLILAEASILWLVLLQSSTVVPVRQQTPIVYDKPATEPQAPLAEQEEPVRFRSGT